MRADDQIVVIVGVKNRAGTASGSEAAATVTIKDTRGKFVNALRANERWPVTAGIPEWKNTDESLMTHEITEWVSTMAMYNNLTCV